MYNTVMFLPIDPGSGLPIYRQIAEQVRRMAVGGSLKPGERLPSVRDLAGTLQVNPLTVAKAYGELEREGVVEMRRGLGMFLAPPSPGAEASRKEAARAAADRLALEAHQAGLSLPEASRLLADAWRKAEKGAR